MGEPVILLHGLMMRRPALLPMAWRLRGRGFAPELFTYSTLWRDPEEAIVALAARLRARGDRPPHLLAHSLGGLVALEALRREPGLPQRPDRLPGIADRRQRRRARHGRHGAGPGFAAAAPDCSAPGWNRCPPGARSA